MKPVILYSTPWCVYCHRARGLLERKGIPYEEIDLAKDAELRMELSQKTGMRTVPMIFIGDECIGGSDELHQLDRTGKLDEMLT